MSDARREIVTTIVRDRSRSLSTSSSCESVSPSCEDMYPFWRTGRYSDRLEGGLSMRRTAQRVSLILFVLIPLVSMMASPPAHASDKYVVDKAKPIDDARRPAAGKALVYFIRSQTMGAAVKVKLYADTEFLGIIASHTYIPFECDPGKHEFIASAENAGFLRAEFLPDRIYYVQVAIHMGAMKARTHFEVARTGSEAMEEITKDREDLHLVTTTEEGRKWVNE